MFYNILDKKRFDILPAFAFLKEDFYLAGGTALALQIGHRDSVDFDFFCKKDIDTKKLFDLLKDKLGKHKILKTQDEINTLSILLDGDIKISFFAYKYELLNEIIKTNYLQIASLEDIACMKLSAITSRATNKDYIDLYYILQKIKLSDLLEKVNKKFSDLDINLILKSLTYFDDIQIQPIVFRNDNFVDFEEVKKTIEQKVLEVTKV